MSTKKLSEELGQLSTCAIGSVIRVHADTLGELRDMALALKAESVADLVAAGWYIDFALSGDGKAYEAWASRSGDYSVGMGMGDSVAAALTELRKKIGEG